MNEIKNLSLPSWDGKKTFPLFLSLEMIDEELELIKMLNWAKEQ